ncbi:MAG: hypothetical protein ABIQ18_06655 [Umezawaea sp.]
MAAHLRDAGDVLQAVEEVAGEGVEAFTPAPIVNTCARISVGASRSRMASSALNVGPVKKPAAANSTAAAAVLDTSAIPTNGMAVANRPTRTTRSGCEAPQGFLA